MNYYQARQRKSDGKWHYTCMNDGRVWPIGYCAMDCPGHDTADEAEAHQREYLLDHRLRLDGEYVRQQIPCAVCGVWTSHFAEIINDSSWPLCDEHRTRAEVEKLYDGPGIGISSY